MNRVLRHPADLARQLGVTLPSTAETNGQTPHTTPVVTGVPEPVDLAAYPKVAAAVDRDTGDRSEDTARVVGACLDSGLTLDQTRWAVASRTDLNQKLAELNHDDVARLWLKFIDERQKLKWMIGNPSGQPLGQLTPVDADTAPDPLENAIQQRMNRLRADREAKRRLDDEDRPAIHYPPVRSLPALLAENFGPVRYRIDKLAPAGGRVLLSAQYKAGKSTLVDNLVRALVDGSLFLGQFTPTPAEALVLIDNEMSDRTVQDWLAAQSIANPASVADVITLRGNVGAFNLLDERCRAHWAQRLADLSCDYLILDCLRPILDALGLDESHDAGKFLVAFDALLYEAGIGDALLVHHMGHTGERARGDSRLQDWPDAIWRLVREDDEPGSPRYFSAYGRDVDIHEGRLGFDPVTRRLTYAAGSRTDAKTEAAYPGVIALLAESAEPLGVRAIQDGLRDDDHPQKAIRAAIKKGVANGVLDVDKTGPRGAHLHSIADPCDKCGMPLTGQQERHESCQ